MRILIIEDDELSLVLLEEIFEKYFPQVKISGCFSEAEEALEFLEGTSVDLIITDIKLPGMDGISFAEVCTERYPFTPIILLSAYSEFEYARKAINTSVVNYILKPVTYDNLYEAITSIEKTSTTVKHVHFMDFATMEQYSNFLRNYLSGNISEWRENSADLPVDRVIDMKYISVLSMSVLEYDNYIKSVWHHGEEKLVKTMNNVIFSSAPEFCGLVISHNNEKFDIVCIFENKTNAGYIKRISESLLRTLKMQSVITEIMNISPIEDIKNNILKYKINKMLETFLSSEVPAPIPVDEFTLEELKYTTKILSENFVKYVGADYAGKFNLDTISYNRYNTREDMTKYVSQLIEAINTYKRINCDDAVERAIKYIEVNYVKKLTLTIIADYVALSPKYFSRLFKKKTNRNVSDYIEEIRIHKAMEIMRMDTNIKLHNLYEKLGYDTYSTFYKNFKKYSQMTPGQYMSDIKKQ